MQKGKQPSGWKSFPTHAASLDVFEENVKMKIEQAELERVGLKTLILLAHTQKCAYLLMLSSGDEQVNGNLGIPEK